MLSINFKEEISLKEIYESGQCFRWKNVSDGSFRIIAGDRAATVSQVSTTKIGIDPYAASPDSTIPDEAFWNQYFDAGTSYSKIRKLIPTSDAYLYEAAQMGSGIRILRQDPWEMIITFIISQRKNIPAIRTCVEKLCRVAGQKIRLPFSDSHDTAHPSVIDLFPTPEEILAIGCNKSGILPDGSSIPCRFQQSGYESCSLGYRMPYVQNAATRIHAHSIEDMQALSDEELLKTLMKIKGVGIKVASCIMLFGFHRLNAFPVDVWMKRVLTEQYPAGFESDAYAPYAGVMQQYLFCRVRKENRS